MAKYVKLQQLLEFETVFPKENVLSPLEYLKGGNKDVILKIAAIFNTFDVRIDSENDYRKIFNNIFCDQNDEFKNYLLSKILELERDNQAKVLVFNPYSNIKLFEIMFNQPDEKEIQDAVEFERNFIKAYLAINSYNTKDEKRSEDSIKELPSNLKIAMSLFCILFPKYDKINYNKNELWVTEIYKAVYLFQFLEQNPKTKDLLDFFLQYYGMKTWREYLATIITLTKPAILNDDKSIINIEIQPSENFNDQCNFIDKLSVDYTDEFEEYDFVTTRSKPFYKVESGKYRIIYKLFLIEKIFTGLYFSLREINKTLDENQKIANWRSFYCKEFSEKCLTYKVVKSIYEGTKIMFSGQELDNLKIDGALDFYVRKGKNILLFESKDFLLTSKVKASSDYKVYVQEFSKSLYAKNTNKGKGKNGAILQFKEQIKKLLQNEFIPDKHYKYREIIIYPIIITHHRDYDTNGLNVLINDWFQKEIEILKLQGYFIYNIKPITIINIDTLIFNRESLKQGVSLHKLIDHYTSFIKKREPKTFRNQEENEDFLISKTVSFANFVDMYLRDNKIKQPPQWDKMLVDVLDLKQIY